MSIEVTDVKINRVENMGNIVAFVKATINDSICIDGIKIINGTKGQFIGMPSYKTKKNEYRDVVFPVNSETRKVLTDAILSKLNDNEDLF
jgi:stage V sporulation protein G